MWVFFIWMHLLIIMIIFSFDMSVKSTQCKQCNTWLRDREIKPSLLVPSDRLQLRESGKRYISFLKLKKGYFELVPSEIFKQEFLHNFKFRMYIAFYL